MNNLNKILGGLLVVALVYIVFLQGCRGKREIKTETVTIIRIDSVTVTTIDTIRFDTTDFKYITVKIPQYYYDTIRASYYLEDFDESDCDFILKYASIYEDTIKNDTISIFYRARVRGYLDELTMGYKIFTHFYIEKTTLIETEVIKELKKKAFQGFYVGMDLGIGKDGLTHVAPMLEVSTAKVNYNAGFDLNDKAVIVGARFKLGK